MGRMIETFPDQLVLKIEYITKNFDTIFYVGYIAAIICDRHVGVGTFKNYDN